MLLIFGRLHSASFLSREDHFALARFSRQRISSNLVIIKVIHTGDTWVVFSISANAAHLDRFESGCES